MNEITRKNNSSNSDSDESIKNEYNLLGFTSKYKTELYKEEDFTEIKNSEMNSEPKQSHKKLSYDSTSISYSQENNNLSEKGQKKRSDLTKDDILSYNKGFFDISEKQRKMSSPLLNYFDGFDKHLSRSFKSTIDLQNSSNYMKKEDFFSSDNSINDFQNVNNEKIEYKTLANSKGKNNEKTKRQKYNSKKLSFNSNINNNFNNNIQFMNNNNINNFNNYNNNYINNNLYFYNNNYAQNQIFNINYINLTNFPNNTNMMNKRKMTYNSESNFIGNCFNNILYPNNIHPQPNSNIIQLSNQPKLNPILFSYNESQDKYSNSNTNNKNSGNTKTVKKQLDIRKGDWKCPKCNNLNFAFRVVCNRCKLQKPADIEEKK